MTGTFTADRDRLVDAIACLTVNVATSGPARGLILADSMADAIIAALSDQRAAPDPLAPVYRWLVDELGFPFDMRTTAKPPWLDVTALSQAWAAKDARDHGYGGAPPEDFADAILSETGWAEEGSPS
jgi:hypothetical protein